MSRKCDGVGLSRPNRVPNTQDNVKYQTARPSALPAEILDNILHSLSQLEQISVLPVNRFFYSIAARRVYRSLSLRRPRQCVAFCCSALANPDILLLVRSLDIDISAASPTANLYHLLQRVLRRTTSLVSLLLELPKWQSPLWIFDGCTFRLEHFTTSLHSKLPLARFLDTQPNITDLTLRGFQSDNLPMLPFFDLMESVPDDEDFKLQPTSLPKLVTFNAIHAGAPVIRAIVEGRPLEVVSIPLFPSLSLESLDALKTASVPLKRLSVISFDPDAPQFLFQVLSTGFADLEALHLVMLMADYTEELLEQSGTLLGHFKALKYITFMAACDESSSIDEGKIAKQWHNSCPTLRTIILPKGRVWFQGSFDNSEWDCLSDVEP
ncbi:hypothetical protein B0H34DRAFT_664486 [Crassisporium funariophilum]|nr:hypothetical protein B0H34DRAFT_664486 [Crassisporium funariophilum]